MSYETYGWYKSKDLETFSSMYADWDHSLDQLLAQTAEADMCTLNASALAGFAYSVGRYGKTIVGRTSYEVGALSHIGITGMHEERFETLVVLGGFIVHEDVRGQGIGFQTLRKATQQLSSGANQARYGHEGFLMKCNDQSAATASRLGFAEIDFEASKHIMRLPLVQ